MKMLQTNGIIADISNKRLARLLVIRPTSRLEGGKDTLVTHACLLKPDIVINLPCLETTLSGNYSVTVRQCAEGS
jgi:hypothetical protein